MSSPAWWPRIGLGVLDRVVGGEEVVSPIVGKLRTIVQTPDGDPSLVEHPRHRGRDAARSKNSTTIGPRPATNGPPPARAMELSGDATVRRARHYAAYNNYGAANSNPARAIHPHGFNHHEVGDDAQLRRLADRLRP